MKRKAFLALGFLALGLGVSQVGPFRARLEAAIQTGGEAFAQVMLSQDKAQALCTQYRDKLPPELVPAFLAEQRALIKYPASGKLMGDWKNGEKVFTDPKRGNCYACHQGDPREVAYGTMGPSLTGYGQRGLSEARRSTTPGPLSPAPSCTGAGCTGTSPPRRRPTWWPTSSPLSPPLTGGEP